MGISIITNKLPSLLATREPTLQDLIQRGTAEEVKNLIVRNDLSINTELPNGEPPLHFAVYQNRPEIVIKLLEMNADLEMKNSEGLSAIDVAVLTKNETMLTHIFAHKLGQDFNEIASQIKNKSSESYIANLQAKLSKIETVDRNQLSDLNKAILNGDMNEIRSRLSKENISTLDAAGLAPIHYAALSCKREVLDLLIEFGADINLRSRQGDTALHIAACKKSLSGITQLLEKGAMPNIQNAQGQTPLHYACAKEDLTAVMALVKGSADSRLKDSQGMNPLVLMGATAYARDPLVLSTREQLMAVSAGIAASCMAASGMGYISLMGSMPIFFAASFCNNLLELTHGLHGTKSILGKALAVASYLSPLPNPLYQAWATYHVAKTSFQRVKKSSRYLGSRKLASLRNIFVHGINTAYSSLKLATDIAIIHAIFSLLSQGQVLPGQEKACSGIDPKSLKDLPPVDRILIEELDPKCPEDACTILSADCTLDAVKADGEKYVNKLYKKAAIKVHPDQNKGDDRAFVKLVNAKDELLKFANNN